jgi:hypothetical protein
MQEIERDLSLEKSMEKNYRLKKALGLPQNV